MEYYAIIAGFTWLDVFLLFNNKKKCLIPLQLDKLFLHKTTLPPSTAPNYCDEVGTREGCFLTQRLLHRFFRVSLLAKSICSQLSLHLSHQSCLSNKCNVAITLFKCNQGWFLSGLPQCCTCTHTSKHEHYSRNVEVSAGEFRSLPLFIL